GGTERTRDSRGRPCSHRSRRQATKAVLDRIQPQEEERQPREQEREPAKSVHGDQPTSSASRATSTLG
ncbi:MAG: hypothetical protein ACK56F_30455, partial [bacterium]